MEATNGTIVTQANGTAEPTSGTHATAAAESTAPAPDDAHYPPWGERDPERQKAWALWSLGQDFPHLRELLHRAIVTFQTAEGWQEGSGSDDPTAIESYESLGPVLREMLTSMHCMERDVEILDPPAEMPKKGGAGPAATSAEALGKRAETRENDVCSAPTSAKTERPATCSPDAEGLRHAVDEALRLLGLVMRGRFGHEEDVRDERCLAEATSQLLLARELCEDDDEGRAAPPRTEPAHGSPFPADCHQSATIALEKLQRVRFVLDEMYRYLDDCNPRPLAADEEYISATQALHVALVEIENIHNLTRDGAKEAAAE